MTGDAGITSTIIWNVGPTGAPRSPTCRPWRSTLGDVDFSADGRHLLASSGGGAIRVWDPETWSTVRTFGAVTTPTPSGMPDVLARLSPTTSGHWPWTPAVGSSPPLGARERAEAVEVWEIETGRRAFTVPGGHGPRWPAWSPDGQLLAIVDEDGGR